MKKSPKGKYFDSLFLRAKRPQPAAKSEEKLIFSQANTLIFYQILSTYSIWKCSEASLKNLYVDIGV